MKQNCLWSFWPNQLFLQVSSIWEVDCSEVLEVFYCIAYLNDTEDFDITADLKFKNSHGLKIKASCFKFILEGLETFTQVGMHFLIH